MSVRNDVQQSGSSVDMRCQPGLKVSHVSTSSMKYILPILHTCLCLWLMGCAASHPSQPEASRFPTLSKAALDAQNATYNEEYMTRLAGADDNPESARAVAPLALFYHANNHYPEAIEVYRHLIELEPTEARWPYLLSRILQDRGDSQGAIDLLETVNHLDPRYAVAYYRKAELLNKNGQPAAARIAYQQCLEQAPDHPYALLALGRQAVEAQDWWEARRLLNEAIASEPTLATAYMLLVPVYQNLGSAEMAERARIHGRSHDRFVEPQDPWLSAINEHCFDLYRLNLLADTYGSTFRFAEAVQYYEKALRIAPKDARTLRELGILYLTHDHQQEGMEYIRQALALDPSDVDAQLEYTNYLYNNSGRAETLAALAAALSHCPQAPSIALQAGSIYKAYGLQQEAEAILLQGLQLDPAFTPLLETLTELYWEQNRFQSVVEYGEQLRQLAPHNSIIRGRLASIFIARNDFDPAAALLDEAISLDPQNRVLQEMRAAVYVEEGLAHWGENDLAAAESALQNALTQAKQYEPAVTQLVNFYRSNGRSAESRAVLAELLREHPQTLFAYPLMAQVYLNENMPARSREFLEYGLEQAQRANDQAYVERLQTLLETLPVTN